MSVGSDVADTAVKAVKGKGFLAGLARFGASTVSLTGRSLISKTMLPQVGIGAVAGGIWGLARSDSDSTSGKFRSAAEGAMLGAAAGASLGLSTNTARVFTRGYKKNIKKVTESILAKEPELGTGMLGKLEANTRGFVMGGALPALADSGYIGSAGVSIAGAFSGIGKFTAKKAHEHPGLAVGMVGLGYGGVYGLDEAYVMLSLMDV